MFEAASLLLLVVAGAAAGFIDSIAGGGGLITLPTLSLFFQLGPHAIGTNKIVGSVGALVACFVYAKKQQLEWKSAAAFGAWVAVGSFLGSSATPYLPQAVFRWMLIIASPCVLWLVYQKNLWQRLAPQTDRPCRFRECLTSLPLALAGLGAGFYDGFFGPGGGTVMFLGLYFVARQPLLMAIAGSKLVNSFSALTALAVYGAGGYVHWSKGCVMATGMLIGAYGGAHLASEKAAVIVRPVLAGVVILLVTKLVFFS